MTSLLCTRVQGTGEHKAQALHTARSEISVEGSSPGQSGVGGVMLACAPAERRKNTRRTDRRTTGHINGNSARQGCLGDFTVMRRSADHYAGDWALQIESAGESGHTEHMLK